ncbi:MAG: nucleotide exchange factor GrpE [Pseudohongiellaceae bacterium]
MVNDTDDTQSKEQPREQFKEEQQPKEQQPKEEQQPKDQSREPAGDESPEQGRNPGDIRGEMDTETALNEMEQAEPRDEEQSEESGDSESWGEYGDLSLEQALERLAEAEDAVARHQEDVLRFKADMQNVRRRAEQDVERAHKYGLEKFAGELLAVMDNLERALEATEGSDNEQVKALADGVELTRKSFVDCFEKFNVEQINPLGEPFNPDQHQAITVQENPDVEPDTVVAVMQKGYILNGRVIRPAMVVVAK